jgi:PAS domain S-box-containing protein
MEDRHPDQGKASLGVPGGPQGGGHRSIPDASKRRAPFWGSIKTKLVLLVLIAVLPIAAVVIHSGLKLQEEEAGDVYQETLSLVRNLTAAHERAVAGTRQLLTVLSKMPEVRSLDGPACSALFAELLKQNPLYTDIIATDAGGRSFASGSGRVRVDLGDRKYFRDARAMGDFSVGEYAVSRTTNSPVLAFAYPIVNAAGRFRGVVIAGMGLDRYGDLLSTRRLSQDATFTITDRTGIVLLRRPGADDRRGKSDIPELIRQMLAGGEEGVFPANRIADGDRRIVGYKRFHLKEGAPPYLFIRVSISAKKALARARSDLLASLALLGAAFIIALVCALFIGNRVIVERLRRLVTASGDLGKGNLGVRTGLPHKEDELGFLARAFDGMAEGLEGKERERRRAEEALRESEEAAIHLSQESMAMVRIGQIIGSTLNIDDIYEQFAGEVSTLIAFDRISIGIIDRAKALVTMAYASGTPMRGRKKGDIFPLAGTMAERVVQTRSGVLISEEDTEELRARFPSLLLLKEFDKSTWSRMVVPLIAQDKVIGALHFGSLKADAYSRRDLSLAERIAAQIAGAVANAQLFNEVKEAEARLRESEEKYRDIFDNSIEGIYVGTPEGRPMSINPALAHMHGFTSPEEMLEEITQVGTQLYVNSEDRVRYQRVLEEHGEVRDFEAEQYRKDGSIFWASISARAVKNGRGEVVRYEATIEDITERKRLEGELRQAQKMEAIGQLAGGVAHDFNNLLTVIMGFANLIQGGMAEDDPSRPYVDQILVSSEKAANLTQSLLAFSRKQRINLEPHNINTIVTSAGSLLKRLLTEDIELRIRPGEVDGVALVDATQIDEVLMNLATNARDAMPKGGILTIETATTELDDRFIAAHGFGKAGRHVLLTVSDNGIGMDEPTQRRIFEPFFTTKEVGKGTGLGLSTVYGIVKQHNGYVTVSSEPGAGTVFSIYLPLLDLERRHKAPVLTGAREGGTDTILIAEDDPDVRRLMTQILQPYGYSTLEAVDGEDAVRLFREHRERIDLVILDVVMPKKNGKEVFEEIRGSRHDARVIFISGYTGDIVLDKGVEDKTTDFLQKPLSPDGLLAKVREVLDR